MKKLVCVILAVIFVFSLTACNKETSQKKIMSDSTSDQLATTVKYPVPVTLTYEESENNLGARYTFTLKEFNEMLNSACKNLGTSEIEEFFDNSNWCVMSDN